MRERERELRLDQITRKFQNQTPRLRSNLIEIQRSSGFVFQYIPKNFLLVIIVKLRKVFNDHLALPLWNAFIWPPHHHYRLAHVIMLASNVMQQIEECDQDLLFQPYWAFLSSKQFYACSYLFIEDFSFHNYRARNYSIR